MQYEIIIVVSVIEVSNLEFAIVNLIMCIRLLINVVRFLGGLYGCRKYVVNNNYKEVKKYYFIYCQGLLLVVMFFMWEGSISCNNWWFVYDVCLVGVFSFYFCVVVFVGWCCVVFFFSGVFFEQLLVV